jgi:hypothetical protein
VTTAGVNVLVDNNDFQNLSKGFNLDTGWGHRVVIRNNRMRNVSQGIYIGCWEEGQGYGASDWQVQNNSILVGTTRPENRIIPYAGIHINGWITNLTVLDNRIGVTKDLAGKEWTNRFGILMAQTTGATIGSIRDVQLIGNQISSELLSVIMTGGETSDQVTCTIDNTALESPGRIARGFPEKNYFWSANRAGDIVVSEAVLLRGIPEVHIAFSQLHRNSRIVIPSPKAFRGKEFLLTVSRHSPANQPGCATVVMEDQPNRMAGYLDDPSEGKSFSPHAHPSLFFDMSVQKFSRTFDMLCGTGSQRYAAYRLYSDGNIWIVGR